MRGVVRQIEEERPVAVTVDEPQRVLRDEVGGVSGLGAQLVVSPPVRAPHGVDVRVVVDVAADEAAELVEPVPHRVLNRAR